MRTLIRILLKFKSFLLFLFLEICSLIMIVNHNQFQRVHFFSSANIVIGSLHAMTSRVSDYFSLGLVNDGLVKENAELKKELVSLRSQVQSLQYDTTFVRRNDFAEKTHFRFMTAKVVQASSALRNNYLTIDKGRVDGVKDGMGVVNDKGIVGIICEVSDHFSLVMPILNSYSRVNAKVQGKSDMGTLIWDGADRRYAQLEEVPKYIPVAIGDTVYSSAYSSVFPENILIGKVVSKEALNDNFYSIEVELSVDFTQLSYVDVIDFNRSEELKSLKGKEELE